MKMITNSNLNAEEVVQRYNNFVNKVEIGKLPYVTKERIDKNFENYTFTSFC